jgi:competence protein ComEA
MADADELPSRPPPPLTWRDLVDRVVPPDRAARLRLVGTVAVLVVLAAGAWWLLRPPPVPATELSLPRAPAAAGSVRSTATTAAPSIVVHAAGAVATPGVLSLRSGARVADLLTAAGGPAPDADLDRVNLAAPLVDGQRVWFPRIGEAAPPSVPGEGGPAPPATGDGSAGGVPVDLNTATVDELEALPGVGPTIAAAIVQHRERSGPFRSVDELLDVAGIGPSRLEQLRELVTV